ncbi:MAG: sn-glycerol-1-phosphate dehydrogenase [Clostridia bacterium]|nr:sn-glycerol-1-phosphate dehydrogenase [Clostridia bacterium]
MLKGKTCDCGKHHSCDIEYVYIEDGAIQRLTEICKAYNRILLVADENTFAAAGDKTERTLSGQKLKKIVFPGNEILIPNENAIEKVRDAMEETELIVGIGSGVIQDLCKYVAFFAKIPYIIVATAPSMDGYASDGAAMILNGMKETVKAGLPMAIVADTKVLKDAPMEMIQGGYGDIIGKYSALNDWKLSHLVNDEYFCQHIYDTTYQMIELTISVAEGIAKREEESIRILTEALIVVGIMMSFAGSSRPASGSEHHLSHFFEIVGIVKNEPYFPHGVDVGYATVVTALLREKILENSFAEQLYRIGENEYQDKMREIYDVVAPECMALQRRIGNYAKNRISLYREKETEIRSIFSEMPNHETIIKLLGAVDLKIERFYELYGEEKINTAISYAKDLKDRYTVLWLYYDMFGEMGK